MASQFTPLQDVVCPTCRVASTEVVYTLDGGEAGPRTVVRCPTCFLLFVSPRITSEHITAKYTNKAYFEREDSSTGYRNYLEDQVLHEVFFRTNPRPLSILPASRSCWI